MGTTGIQIKMLQASILIKDFWCMFPAHFNALPDKWGFSTANLTGCIIHWWATHHPICASPQSRRAGIAPSYRAWLTACHSSHSQARGSHAWPASWLRGLHTCAYQSQSKLVISSSLQCCFIRLVFSYGWFLLQIQNLPGVSGQCWQSSNHLPQKTYVWKLVIVSFTELQELHEYFTYLIPRWLLPSSLKFKLHPPCLGIILFLHATSYSDALNQSCFLLQLQDK